MRGSFTGSWALEAVNLDTGASAACSDPGSITITTQSGSSFSGSFVINGSLDCYGEVVTGNIVRGSIRADGGLDFVPEVPGQQLDIFALLGCTGAGDDRLVGLLSGSRLTASGEATLTCFGETALIQVSVDVRR